MRLLVATTRIRRSSGSVGAGNVEALGEIMELTKEASSLYYYAFSCALPGLAVHRKEHHRTFEPRFLCRANFALVHQLALVIPGSPYALGYDEQLFIDLQHNILSRGR
jgi:hypothetical protein